MGCNVEKAKVKIADIINSGMKSNSAASSERAMKQAEQFANVLDKIKSNYVLNKDVNYTAKTASQSGFQGYVGGFSSSGKGTSEGDGKDKAMREVANGFIGEVNKSSDSSTLTSYLTISETADSTTTKNDINAELKEDRVSVLASYEEELGDVIMLARNGSLKGKELQKFTKRNILDAHEKGATFIIGDMPGVDSKFIEYLDEIGASYKIYHTGKSSRIIASEQDNQSGSDEKVPTEKETKLLNENFNFKDFNIDGDTLYFNELNDEPTTLRVNANTKEERMIRGKYSNLVKLHGSELYNNTDVENMKETLKSTGVFTDEIEKLIDLKYEIDSGMYKKYTYKDAVKFGNKFLKDHLFIEKSIIKILNNAGLKDVVKSNNKDKYDFSIGAGQIIDFDEIAKSRKNKNNIDINNPDTDYLEPEFQKESKYSSTTEEAWNDLLKQKYRYKRTEYLALAKITNDAIDKFAKLYPKISVSKIKDLKDENNNVVFGKAIGAAIELNISDIRADTVPHEYAHVYINMLEDSTEINTILNAIEKRRNVTREAAKEILANKIGEAYVDKELDLLNKDIDLIEKIWKSIVTIINKIFNKKDLDELNQINSILESFTNGSKSEVIDSKITMLDVKNKTDKTVSIKKDATYYAELPYKISPELAQYGSIEDYKEYVKTIFPDSEIKDVLAHDTGSVGSMYSANDLSKSSFTDSWMYTDDVEITGKGENFGLVSGEGFYMYNPNNTNGNVWDQYAGATGYMLVNMKKPLMSSSKEYKDLKGLDYYSKMSNLTNTEIQSNPDTWYMLDEHPEKVTINSIVNKQTGYDGFVNQVRPGLFEYVAWKNDQVHILGSKKDIEGFKNFTKNLKKEAVLSENNTVLVPVSKPEFLKDIKEIEDFKVKNEFHITMLGFAQGKELSKLFESNPEYKDIVNNIISSNNMSYKLSDEQFIVERDREAWIDWKDQSKGKENIHEETIIQLVDAPGIIKSVKEINEKLGTKFPIPFPHITIAIKGNGLGIGISDKKYFDSLKKDEISLENFTENTEKETKGSMDSKSTENVDIISTDVTNINIKDELLGFVASGASAYDKNVDMDFFGNFIETIKKVSANLEKYGLDKNIEFRQHKMATDRYTRGTYTFGEDVAKDNSHLSGSDNGYMFEIDGGVVDIYYGKGFYNETEDGIVQNELRQDISLSTNTELIMHEILHSMIEKAYDQDKELNRALFLLKEQVMKKISYKDLLGKDESEATNAEIQLAKDIYAYMHNPTEFLAYAATNQNVFLAVKDLTIKNTLIGKFEPKRGDTIGKFKQFLNRFIDAINKIYTSMTTGESAKTEFDKILNGLIEVNTKIEIGALDIKMEKEFKPYAAFGIGEKFKKTNDWMLEAEKGAFSKLKDVWSADSVRNKAEGAGRFIESIGDWRGLQWLRDTRLISDLVTDMVEDTTSDGVAWFYEAVRHIKGTREKDKLDFATVMKKKVGAEFGEFSKEERSAVTFMLQGDWKALGVNLSEYKDMLTDESKVEARISDLKSQIKHPEYINQSAMLGYYLVNGEAKGSATMKSAYQIVHRFHTGKESSPLQSEIDTDSMIKLVDELSSLYAIKYTEKSTKDNIVSAIERDADVVSFGSDTYYAYRLKEQNGQLAMFGKYMDKGYVRKSGEVDMKFDIIPESKLIRNSKISALNHKIIRELPEVQNNMHDAGLNNSFEKYYLVVERDMDPARTQGVLDDISIIEQGQELASFTAGKSIDYADMKSYTTRRFGAYEKTYLNKPIDDSIEAMRDRKSYSISNIDINGNIIGYAEPVSEADKVNHGRINNDIADVLGNTASHIQSKEKALLNNQNFIELLITDSNNNIGTPGYVFISPDSREVELQKYWAMIPDYSRSFIEHETAVKGLWVKRSRINNIVGYKDASISNMRLFGLKLEDYPEWQKAIKIVEHTWKEIASAYKEIIVKLMPNVILSNATSNMFVAVRHGIGPMEYAKGFRKAWSELSEYMELNEQLVSLKIDRDIGKKGLSPKIAELEKRLERNGMHPLIKDGQFSMIFEDLDKDSTSKSTHLKDISSAKVEQWFGKNVADNLEEFRQNVYVTKETRGHQAIEKLTLFNDIINKKIIMDKMTQDINEINFATPEAKEAAMIDMINYLDQLFVNYSYLTNKYIKWASDLNVILFLKYFLRAGKAALNMTRRQPLGSLVSESFDTFIWNVPDPIDQYMTPVSTVSGKIGLSPIDMIGEVLFPRIITVMP